MLFLVYINDLDLVDNVDNGVKISADHTSFFSVVLDEAIAAQKLNRDLKEYVYGHGSEKWNSN